MVDEKYNVDNGILNFGIDLWLLVIHEMGIKEYIILMVGLSKETYLWSKNFHFKWAVKSSFTLFCI
jgi:hypothetical protein